MFGHLERVDYTYVEMKRKIEKVWKNTTSLIEQPHLERVCLLAVVLDNGCQDKARLYSMNIKSLLSLNTPNS